MVRFGTKNLDRQDWLPQHQQLTKNKMVRLVPPYHFGMPKSSPHPALLSNIKLSSPKIQPNPSQSNPVQHAFFTPRILAITNSEHSRTPTNTVEHQNLVPPKASHPSSRSHRKKNETVNRRESLQLGAKKRRLPQITTPRHGARTFLSAESPIISTPTGFRTRMRTRMSALRDASCALYSAHCRDCFYVRRAA
jgi:hypothetical protein